MKATHLHVEAEVRYWEDATINGTEDVGGFLVPLRKGDKWCPVIELQTGRVLNWPADVTADIHYKVCDQGEYWLGTDTQRTHKYKHYYVPDEFLCVGDTGYGDYIIFTVLPTGCIQDWQAPTIDPALWQEVAK